MDEQQSATQATAHTVQRMEQTAANVIQFRERTKNLAQKAYQRL